MRQRGFTLVELLATIVIIAIIALITIPLINGVIGTAQKGAFRSSVYGLIDAAEIYLAENAATYDKTKVLEFECNGTDCKEKETEEVLKFKGKVPISGSIKINTDGTIESNYIKNGNYCALGTKENLDIQKDCGKLDGTAPELTVNLSNVSSNAINIVVSAKDLESGINKIDYSCGDKEYSVTYDTDQPLEDIVYTFDNLENGKEYSIVVTVTNRNGMTTNKTLTVTTYSFSAPEITMNSIPSIQNGYVREQIATVTFSSENIDEPQYFIQTTRNAISSVEVTQSYGTGTLPGTAETITSTTSLIANVWYKVPQSIKVTYNEAASEIAFLTAIISDGTNFDVSNGSNSMTVNKVDRTSPGVTIDSIATTTNNVVIAYTLNDAESGLGTPTCKYGEVDGTYDKDGSTTNSSCTLSDLNSEKEYYYQVCVADKVENTATCKTGSTKTEKIENPIITLKNTPETAVNGYLKSQVANVVFNGTGISNPQYFVKTTRLATIDVSVTESCGSGTTPSACESISSTKTLSEDTWYKVSDNVNITYDQPSTENDTLYAITFDGTNYNNDEEGRSTATISKIFYDAADVSYTNEANSSITNVKEALDYLYDNLI